MTPANGLPPIGRPADKERVARISNTGHVCRRRKAEMAGNYSLEVALVLTKASRFTRFEFAPKKLSGVFLI